MVVASVGKINSGSGYDYLTRAVAKDRHDYYTGSGEAPGMWAGTGRHELELDGEVIAQDMHDLYGRFVDPRTAGNKRSDATGRPLGEEIIGEGLLAKPRVINAGTANERELVQVAAYDVTFSPSKSVSVLWAMSAPEVQAT